MDPAKVAEGIWDKGEDGFAEYEATQIESDGLNRLWDYWNATGEGGLARDAQTVADVDADVHKAIGQLAEQLLSGAGVPGPAFLGSVAQLIPVDCLDHSLGDVGFVIEIAGIVICVLSGNPLLGCACFKALVHDVVHRMLVAEIKYLLAGGHSETPGDGKPTALEDRIGRGTHHTIATPAGTQPAGTAREAHSIYVARNAGRTDGPRRDPRGPARAGSPVSSPAPAAGTGARKTGIHLAGGPGLAEGLAEESAGPRRQEGGDTRAAATPGSGDTEFGYPWPPGGNGKLTFIRLRIHYELMDVTAPIADSAWPNRLIRLIVVRESCPVPSPEAPEEMNGGRTRSADVETGYIARQLDKAALPEVQLWRATDTAGLALEPVSVAALQAGLARIFTGLPAKLDEAGLVSQEISADSALRLLGPASRCIEIAGFAAETSGRPAVQCIAVKATVDDEFCRIAVAAITGDRS